MKRLLPLLLLIVIFPGSNMFSQTFSNGTDYAIPDNNGTGATSTIAVSGLATSLNCSSLGLQGVCIKISHIYDADLDIYLVAPDGTTIELSTDNGGSGDHYGSNTANDLTPYTCFNMTAATAITAGTSPFNGTYRPEGNLGSANNGQNPNGNWSLRVYDDASGDVGTLLYWQLTFATTSLPCPSVNISTTSLSTCGATYYDNGGTGNYTNNQNVTQTICSSSAGQCVSAAFSSFSLENGYDYLYIYDGSSTLSPQFAGSPYTGTVSPGTITATTASTGCLTFQFISDNGGTAAGWAATLSCQTCATPPSPALQDCSTGSVQVCSNANLAGNSSGGGNVGDLNPTNRGCLFEETNSSWYYINIGTTGTLQFSIAPTNGSDDYDFALWGPTNSCPPQTAPVRCNYAAYPSSFGCGTNTNPTGLNGSATATSAAACDNTPFLQQLNVTAGQTYILLIDGYTPSSQNFNLTWGGTTTLSCTPVVLPIELLEFSGKPLNGKNLLEWVTASETNNDFFTLERSADGSSFEPVLTKDAAGNSSGVINYSAYDNSPYPDVSYYRLKQTDFNGQFTYSSIIAIKNTHGEIAVSNVHPNPTTNDLNFDFVSPVSGVIKIQVVDYLGQVVIDRIENVAEGKSTLNTQMSGLAKGVYSLRVEFSEGNFRSVTKVVKY